MIKYLLFSFLLYTALCSAQINISGKVTDKNSQPLISANVYLKDTYDGATSDINGLYNFSTSEKGKQTLVVSFIGFKAQEIPVDISGKNIVQDFVLEEEASSTNTVVISAGSFEASDEHKSVILKPLDIVTTGTTADIYTALSTLPGAQLIGNETGLFVRGGSAAETKTYVDEMLIQSPFYSTVPDVPSRGRFSPMMFKGTMFSTGGYSAQYGQALSSALILKSVDLLPDTRSAINLMALGWGGSHTQRWENTSLSIDGMYVNLAPYFKVQKQRLDWMKAPESGEGQLLFRHKFSETGLLKVYSTYENSFMKMRMKNLNQLDFADIYALNSSNYYLNTGYTDILAKEWAFFAGASYSKRNDKIGLNTNNIKSTEEVGQSKVTLSRKIVDGSFLTFGGEIHSIIFNDKFNQYGRKVEDIYSAGFAETDIFFTNKIAARIGLRAEHSKVINKVNFAPRTSLAYKLGKYDQINFAYGKFYQTPEKEYLFYQTNLSFENADHYILNYQYLGENLTFRVEGYYKKYSSLVKLGIDSIYNNSGKGYAQGIDVFFRGTNIFGDNTDGWLSYSYLDTKRDYKDFPYEAMPTFAAPHTFSAVFKQIYLPLKTMYGLTFSYATGRPYYNPNNTEYLGDRTMDYINLSLNVSYLTNILGNFTVVFFSLDNIFGRDNIFTYRYSDDKRTREPIVASSLRTAFIGMFISIGENTTGF